MRRWTRIGIKTILVLIVPVAVMLSWIARERVKFAKCEAALHEIRIQVEPSKERLYIDYRVDSLALRVLDTIRGRRFNYIGFSHNRIPSGRFASTLKSELIDELHGIEVLAISEDPGLRALRQFQRMPNLSEMYLVTAKLQKFDELRHFQRLEKLHILAADVGQVPLAPNDPRYQQLRKLLPYTQFEYQ